jgi:hypothetical protein
LTRKKQPKRTNKDLLNFFFRARISKLSADAKVAKKKKKEVFAVRNRRRGQNCGEFFFTVLPETKLVHVVVNCRKLYVNLCTYVVSRRRGQKFGGFVLRKQCCKLE